MHSALMLFDRRWKCPLNNLLICDWFTLINFDTEDWLAPLLRKASRKSNAVFLLSMRLETRIMHKAIKQYCAVNKTSDRYYLAER